MPSKKPKRAYKKPELRVYGPMNKITKVVWWGFYPDRIGRLRFMEPKGKMKMMMS